ncbi:cation-translocating P-type ATPase [Microvirga sp. W0021]|uniref:P-type Zn(2+) transporter n=1 Tax=Hohaiivirga grylli TaxID=3133970 RepID=A0ABV0BL69_9HYPH
MATTIKLPHRNIHCLFADSCKEPVCKEAVHCQAKENEQKHHVFEPIEFVRVAVSVVAAALVWFGVWEPFPHVSIIGCIGLAFGGWPIFKEAVENLLERRMTMELSMTIAIIAAAAISEFFTALVIMTFVLVAEMLEEMTVSRGKTAIKDLMDVIPNEVTVRRGQILDTISLDDLRAGDIVVVAPGGQIPVDGIVRDGHSYVDQSRITGESEPDEKTIGSSVFASSISKTGALEIEVEKVGRDTSFGRIVAVVEEAQNSSAPVQRLADQLAGYLVYFAMAAAVITYLLTWDIRSTISVIIVAGACGVAAGTPLAILGGIGRSARLGAIIKGGEHLEMLGKIDTVVMDKTGTVTFGEPRILGLSLADGVSEEQLLTVASAAEVWSEHPLAKAIIKRAEELNIVVQKPDEFNYQPGMGVSITLDGSRIHVGNRKLLVAHNIDDTEAEAAEAANPAASEIHVAQDDRYLGSVIVADVLRPEAKHAIKALNSMGIQTMILTGDSKRIADAIAEELGISTVIAEMLPEDKLAKIRGLVDDGKIVAMLGDGVNDAPALTAATVGVAMGSGTDVAKESADIVLLGNDLAKFVETVEVSRKTRRTIWQNFAGTIGVDTLGILLAAFGFLNPLLAAFIHVSSELVFISNSARLLPAADRLKNRRDK